MAQEARRNYLLRLLTPIKRFDRKDGQPARFRLRGVARVRHPEGRIRARRRMRQLAKVGRFPEV